VIDSGGPTLAGLNEYHPLFTRDGFQVQGNLLVGGDNTLADDFAASAVSGIYSLAVGQYHFETDGFRANADQTHDLYNLFFQVAPSPDMSLQVEYRHSESDFGDRVLRFDPDDFSEALRYERKSDSLRLGGRYDLSPRSKLILSLLGEDSEFSRRDAEDLPLYEFDGFRKGRSRSAELQHVYEGERLNLISGLGYLNVELDNELKIYQAAFSPSDPAFVAEGKGKEDYRNLKAYVYSSFQLNGALTLHAGASVFDCENPFLDRSAVHPKLGLTWDMTPATRVRAAGFQTVRCAGSDPAEPALSSPQPESQTIEPTQIAGFNQVFDDATGSVSDVYGIALDHEFSRNIFGGVSFVSRELRVPYLDAQGGSGQADWGEDVGQLYLNWAINWNWATSLEYNYEKLDYGTDVVPAGATELATHRVPLSLRYFSASGWSAGIIPTFVNQEIELYDRFTGVGEKDSESFWVVDAALVYRLPKRHGFVSLEAKNLFDDDFRFQESDANVATTYPRRLFLISVNLYFD